MPLTIRICSAGQSACPEDSSDIGNVRHWSDGYVSFRNTHRLSAAIHDEYILKIQGKERGRHELCVIPQYAKNLIYVNCGKEFGLAAIFQL
jgi:hypothetical protein